MARRRNINFNSSLQGQTPLVGDLMRGEIAINQFPDAEFMCIRNAADQIVKFEPFSSAELESIRNSLTTINNNVLENTEDISELKIRVDGHDTDINNINTNISAEIIRATAAESKLNDEKQNKLVAGNKLTLTPVEDSDFLVRIDFTGQLELFRIVSVLPEVGEPNIIYLVPQTGETSTNKYQEWIWVNDAWEDMGALPFEVDLSNYYTKSEVDALLSNKANAGDLTALIQRVNTHDGDINSINNTIGGIETDISLLKTRVDGHDTDINTIETAVDQHTTDITIIQTTINGHTIDITELKNTVSGHTTQINNINTTIGGIQTNITDLQDGLSSETESRATEDAALHERIDAIDARIFTIQGSDAIDVSGTSEKTVSLKMDPTSESYLAVTEDGLKLSGIAAIATGKLDIDDIVAGANIGIEVVNDKVTISAQDTLYDLATPTSNGLMSNNDKVKLNGIENLAQVNIIEDVEVITTGPGTITKNVDGKTLEFTVDLDAYATTEYVDTEVGNVESNLAQEITNRTNADTALGNRIDEVENNLTQEITDRASGDTALGTRIDGVESNLAQEITDRTNGDTALGTRVDGVENDVTDLQAALAQEITDRASGDTALGTRIDTEVTARTDADIAINRRIDELELGGFTIQGSNTIDLSTGETKTISLKIDPTDKVLTDTTNGLLTNISLVSIEQSAESQWAAQYKLVGKDGTTALGATINITKDQILSKTEYIHNATQDDVDVAIGRGVTEVNVGDSYLVFDFDIVTSGGTTEGQWQYLLVTDLVSAYTAGSGLTLLDKNVFAVDFNQLDNRYPYNVIMDSGATNPSISQGTLTIPTVAGPQGPQGPQGVNGVIGADGVSVYIRYSPNSSGTPNYTTPSASYPYLGVSTGHTTDPGATASAYTWTKYLGDNGTTGPQGPTGATGASAYLHVRYSINANGNPMTTGATTSSRYIGTVSTNSPTGPGSYTGYTWAQFRGVDGTDGTNGTNGSNGTSVFVRYSANANGNPMSTSPNRYIGIATGTTAPTLYTGYSWTQLMGDTGPQGPTGYNGTDGDDGQDGRNGTSVYIRYSANSNGSPNYTTPSTAYPYIGVCTGYEFDPGSSASYYTWTKYLGDNGATGPQGPNGASAYLHIRYSPNSSGSNMTSTPSATSRYIGTVSTNSSSGPTSYTSYTWAEYKGPQGDAGPQGANGSPGTPGSNGTSSYLHVKYSSYSSGSSFGDTPPATGDIYIGTAVTTSSTAPTAASAYKWNQFKGSQGPTGPQGAPGGVQGSISTNGSYSGTGGSVAVGLNNLSEARAQGGFFQDSDERLKTFGEDIEVCLDDLKKLPKKYFTYNTDENQRVHIGTSAQEILKLYPELVSVSEDGMLALDYAKLSVVLLKAIDILHDEIKELKFNR